jgi:hypothetical protein
MADTPQPPRYRSISYPTIPVGHPDFVWKTGADVQATWMRHTNWRPIYTNQPPKYVEPAPTFCPLPLRRLK